MHKRNVKPAAVLHLQHDLAALFAVGAGDDLVDDRAQTAGGELAHDVPELGVVGIAEFKNELRRAFQARRRPTGRPRTPRLG